MKIHPVGAELFQMDRQTDIAKLIVTFCKFTKVAINATWLTNPCWHWYAPGVHGGTNTDGDISARKFETNKLKNLTPCFQHTIASSAYRKETVSSL